MAITDVNDQIVKVNLIPNYSSAPVVYLSQYDTGSGRPLKFNVYDGDSPYTAPSGITIKLEGTRPDGVGFSYNTSKSGSTITVSTYTNVMTYLVGTVNAQLVFTNSSGARVGTIPIIIKVERAGINMDTVISQNDFAAVLDAQNAYNTLNARLEAAIAGTTSDTEVIDIRVKADGTTASTAGNAVREQVSELKNEITQNQKMIVLSQDVPGSIGDFATLVNGILQSDYSIKNTTNMKYRVCTSEEVVFPVDTALYTDTGFRVLWMKREGTTITSSGWFTGETVIPAGTFCKITISRINDIASEIANIPTFDAALHLKYIYADKREESIRSNNDFFLSARKSVSFLGHWEFGGIDNTGTNTHTEKHRISLSDIAYVDETIVLNIDSGYRIYVFWFDNVGTFVRKDGWITESYTIEAGSWIKIIIAKATESTGTLIDISDALNAVWCVSPWKKDVDAEIDSLKNVTDYNPFIIDIYNAVWSGNLIKAVSAEYPNILVKGEGKAYSYAIVIIDVSSVDTVYVKVGEITGSGSKRIRYAKCENGEFVSWIGWASNADVDSYDKFINVSDINQLGIAFYLNATATTDGTKAETIYKNVTVSKVAITEPIVPPITAVDFVARRGTGAENIPDYYLENDYINNKISRVNQLISATAKNGDAFVFITDTHWGLNARKSPALLKKIHTDTHISKLFVGGDMSNTKANDDTYFEVGSVLRDAWGEDIHYVMGNHEYLGAKNEAITTDSDLYYDFRMYADNEIGSAQRHYYYVDNNRQKIRYIFLNKYSESTDGGSHAGTGYEQDQIEWFTNTALNVETGWTIVVITHNIFNTTNDANYNITVTVPTNSQPIYNAIQNYNGNGTIAAVICGHSHLDYITNIGDVPCILTTCDKNKSGGEAVPDSATWAAIWNARSDGTINEQAFDVMILDKENRKITAVRIGYPATVEHGSAVQEREVSY